MEPEPNVDSDTATAMMMRVLSAVCGFSRTFSLHVVHSHPGFIMQKLCRCDGFHCQPSYNGLHERHNQVSRVRCWACALVYYRSPVSLLHQFGYCSELHLKKKKKDVVLPIKTTPTAVQRHYCWITFIVKRQCFYDHLKS